ncbi:uncharacterized protein LOC143451976 isoform X2 [Clavelina lepadiformis]|uniref:uncharacterized protein LOC143451976 isoform X2 n=1 Tax=Clavelina lepadiformis TaxID=159417 RepID=UPI004042A2FA
MAQVREIDASEFTGRDLLKSFEDEVDGSKWVKKKVGEEGKVFTFTGGRYQIKIVANPTPNQKGNGRLSVGGHAHSWETLKPILSDSSFNEIYELFLENELNSPLVNDFERQELACCVILLFEIARRVENERGIDVKFLSRDEVDKAIDKALNCELGSSLTGIFCLGTKRRRSRYDVIMSKPNVGDDSDDGNDIASAMGNMTLNDKVILGPGNLLARTNFL